MSDLGKTGAVPRGGSRLMQIYQEIPRSLYLSLAVASIGTLLLAWWLATALGLVEPLFLASPGAVVKSLGRQAAEGTLWLDIKTSVYRITVGFVISTVTAIPIGILMGTFRFWEAVFEPPIDLIRYMPAVAFVPLSILWLGITDGQKFMLLFIGTFFQEVLLIMDNVKTVNRHLIDVSYTFGLNKWEVLRHVILPAALPGIVDTLRITLGWAWTYLVVAELVAAREGLGYRIMQAQRFLATDVIISGILVIGILGLATDYGFKFAYQALFPWMRRGRE